jgi:hypothetical protein
MKKFNKEELEEIMIEYEDRGPLGKTIYKKAKKQLKRIDKPLKAGKVGGFCMTNEFAGLFENAIIPAEKPIDKVTTKRLDIALRMIGVNLPIELIDNIIDLVELIEDKGEEVTLKDICDLQSGWEQSNVTRT